MSAPTAPNGTSGIALGRPQVTGVPAPVTAALALPTLELDDDEQRDFDHLHARIVGERPELERLDGYYNASQEIVSLGVDLPPGFDQLKTILGWPRVAVDAIHERLVVEGFRYPDSIDADEELWNIWQDNDLDYESDLAHLEALVLKRAFAIGGTNEDGSARITVESPMNMAVTTRRREVRAGLQLYSEDDDTQWAALYRDGETITLVAEDGGWRVEQRDPHLSGVPVSVMTNRARLNDRSGFSEITRDIQAITDAAVRTLLDLDVSRAFYAAPQRFILGASEAAFQGVDGQQKSAWETYRGRILALERDEDGNVPQVGSFAAMDPSALTKIVDCYAEIMSSATGLHPTYFGKSTDQPASADAIRMGTDRLVNRTRRVQRAGDQCWEPAMRNGLAFQNGSVPAQAKRIGTIWRKPEIPTPAADTDAVHKQVQMGYMPPTSDVAGETMGYNPLQRRRIDRDRGRTEQTDALSSILRRTGAAPASSINQAADAVAAVPAGSAQPGQPAAEPPTDR